VNDKPDIIYLGRSRLHKIRANLIQTLHTVSAFGDLGLNVKLVLPPWSRSTNINKRLDQLDVGNKLDINSSLLLHPRFGFLPYISLHRKMLRNAKHVYTRVVGISLALSKLNIPHHLEIHNLESLEKDGSLDHIINNHRKGVTRILVPISQAAANNLVKAGADPNRIHVAHSGVLIESYRDIPQFNSEKLIKPHVVHIGRLSDDRGKSIFRELLARNLIRLTVLSTDDGNLDGAEYHGAVSLKDVPGWYGQSDIILLPYQAEIKTVATMSPIKLFESLATGRPIISSDLPTIREVLHDHENALLVKANDIDAWENAIRELQSSPDLAMKLAATARKTAEQYSWQQRAQGIWKAINA
jgi:glycosyltransferase involved in cell wall biosynthesis